MTDLASVDLDQGLPDPRAVAGRTLVLHPRRDVAFPLVFGLISGLFALGLLTAAIVTIGALARGAVLVVFELLIGVGLGWLAVMMLGDVVAHARFNRRRIELRFELDHVEIASRTGVEIVALADVPSHPLLRTLPIDRRVHTLLRARASCDSLPHNSDIRLVLETLALLHPESQEHDGPGAPPARPIHAIIVRPGEVNFFSGDPDDLADARRSGLPLYRVRTDWNSNERVHAPRLTPAAVTRIEPTTA